MDAAHHETNDVAADGEVAWSRRPDAGAKSVDTIHGRRWQKSPVTEESAKETVKTIVQGMPVDAVYPWLLTPVLSYCTGGLGCNAHPAFPAPSLLRGVIYLDSSDISCRENADSCLSPLSCSAKAGHPVRCGLSASAQPPLEYWLARSSRAMTTEGVAV
jgi:hypothetical protein